MRTDFTKISFWKRNPDNVADILRLEIECLVDKTYLLNVNGKDHSLPKEEGDKLIEGLIALKLGETKKEEKAYLYEDRPQDYRIKFFLVFSYPEATYLAVKGIDPFGQKNYKEIQALFAPLFKKQD